MPLLLLGLLFVAIGGGAGVAIARGSARSAWSRSSSVSPGSRVRWSAPRSVDTSPELLASGLEAVGLVGVIVWTDDQATPPDWPADDRAPGRYRFEASVPRDFATALGGAVAFGGAPTWTLRAT